SSEVGSKLTLTPGCAASNCAIWNLYAASCAGADCGDHQRSVAWACARAGRLDAAASAPAAPRVRRAWRRETGAPRNRLDFFIIGFLPLECFDLRWQRAVRAHPVTARSGGAASNLS